MENRGAAELAQALKAVLSIRSKCEKALEKQRPGSPQHTLLTRRIRAMDIAKELMEQALREEDNEKSAPQDAGKRGRAGHPGPDAVD